MLTTYKDLATNQLEAALRTLHACIEQCPDELWNAPVAKYAFCQVAYHTLFFTDFYLSESIDEFKQQQFHRAHAELFGDYEELTGEPDTLYEKRDLLDYAKFCRDKAVEVVAGETEESLRGPSGFERRRCTRAELHLYNMRHIQHHAAQLILRLRQDSDVDIPWFAHGWGTD